MSNKHSASFLAYEFCALASCAPHAILKLITRPLPTGTPTFVTKPYAKASGPLLGPMVPGMPPFHSVPTNISVGAFTMPLLGTSSTHPAAIPMMSGMLLTGVGGSGPLNLTMQE